MDLRQLEVFVSICRTGNFSKAAKELYLTQPTVSSHIFHLEKELGFYLFERRGRKTELTEAGEKFYPYALGVLDLMRSSRESFSAYKNEFKGDIKIIASQTPGNYLLPKLLKKFKKKYAGVKLDISIIGSEEVVEKLLNYEADLGFVGGIYNFDKLEFIPFEDDELVLIASKNSDLQKRSDEKGEIKLEDILDHPFIVRKRGSATLKIFEKNLEKGLNRDLESLNIALEVDSLEGIKNFVKEGFGVSVISHHCLETYDDLLKLRIKGLDIKRQFHVVYHKGRVMSPSCEKLLEFFTNEKSSTP